MNYNIFYSWQSDLPQKVTNYFIRDAIKLALKKYVPNKFDDIWKLERDTQNVLGTVDIINTIFTKIRQCHIFIGDVSIINKGQESKTTPNPNVLLELGYSASQIGWENIICVQNTAFGKIEELPFDLRGRRVLSYYLPESVDNKTKKENLDKLAQAFGEIFKELDPHLIQLKETFKREYGSESKEANRIVLEQPDRWIERLLRELLYTKLSPLNLKMQEIKNGLVFRKTSEMNGDNHLDWMINSISNFRAIYKVIENIINKEFSQIISLDDKFELATRLQKMSNRIVFLCEQAIEWQIECNYLKLPEDLENVKSLMSDWAETIIISFNNFLEDIDKVLFDYFNSSLKEKVKIKLTLIPLPNTDEVFELHQRWQRLQG